MDIDRTAAFAAIAAAGLTLHEVADYITGQTHTQASEKAHPDYNLTPDVPYWRTWVRNQQHCAAYNATLAVGVAVACRALGIKVRPGRAAAALALSWATHGLIDRRWPVKLICKWTGSEEGYKHIAPQVDQALHKLFVIGGAYIVSSDCQTR